MADQDSVRQTMQEKLDANPDAAFLITIDDLAGDATDGGMSMYANHEDEETEDLARRMLAFDSAVKLAEYFPNEAKDGATRVAGGSFSPNGVYKNPRQQWRSKNADDDTGGDA